MESHAFYLRKSLEIAKRSMDNGNLPFGCILVGPDNTILAEGENTVVTDDNPIAHCEINLIGQIKNKFDSQYLQQATMYASTEPCPMCTGAIFWSGIGRLVFALSKEGYHAVAQTSNPAHIFDMKSAEILSHGGRKVNVEGPLLENEARDLYQKWLG
jgi:tRNA(Arg) A34 adenosine deaminase TadA